MPSTLKWAVASIPEFAIQPLPSGFISTRKNYSFQHWGWLVELCCSLNLFSMTNEIVEVPALFKTLSIVTNAIFSPHAVSARKSWWHHGWSCFFPSTYVTTLSSTAELPRAFCLFLQWYYFCCFSSVKSQGFPVLQRRRINMWMFILPQPTNIWASSFTKSYTRSS